MSTVDQPDWTLIRSNFVSSADQADWTTIFRNVGSGDTTDSQDWTYTSFQSGAPATTTTSPCLAMSASYSLGTNISLTVPTPQGTVSGQFMVGIGFCPFVNQLVSAPSPWVLQGHATDPSGVAGTFYVYTKTAPASPPINETWSCAHDDFGVIIRNYTGVSGLDGGLAATNNNSTNTPNTATWTSVTATNANEIWILLIGYAGAVYSAPPSGFAGEVDTQGGVGNFSTSDTQLTSAGATGTKSGQRTADFWVTSSFLLT